MSKFEAEVARRCDLRRVEVARDLFRDEVTEIEDRLLVEWIAAGSFDDLIRHALDEFELADGSAFCASLGEALATRGDHVRFVRLFGGLAASREAAFWRSWPSAQDGHIGSMKECARYCASAMEALGGLWHCFWKVADEHGMAETKAEMLLLQSRQRRRRKAPSDHNDT